jgi:hypothetical protein
VITLKSPYVLIGFLVRLHCGGCRHLDSGKLGVIDPNSAGGFRDRGPIGGTLELEHPGGNNPRDF